GPQAGGAQRTPGARRAAQYRHAGALQRRAARSPVDATAARRAHGRGAARSGARRRRDRAPGGRRCARPGRRVADGVMSSLGYQVREGVAEITLDNPPANALTESMVAELIAALDRAAADESAAVVLVRSAVPRRFCAGLDLTLLDGATPTAVRSLLETL